MKELVKKLSDLRGISGFEYRLSDEIIRMMKLYADNVYRDSLGNVIAEKKSGLENSTKIMIEGHIDEIGLMVSGIDENGFVSFVNVGGIDDRILPSCEVILHGKSDIPGVIGAKPPHLQTKDESKKPMKPEDMAIDTGYSAEELKKIIRIGTPVTLSQSCGELMNGNISLKALDDRAGTTVVIDVLRRVQNLDLNADIYFVATVQEEVGLRGAKTAANIIKPDIAISVDVCHAVTPDNSEDAYLCGSGCIISSGPNVHNGIKKRLIKLCERFNIPFEIDTDGGYTGTNAWEIQVSGSGVATALLSIPVKYMHNPVEMMQLSDIEAVRNLIYRFIENYDIDSEDLLCC